MQAKVTITKRTAWDRHRPRHRRLSIPPSVRPAGVPPPTMRPGDAQQPREMCETCPHVRTTRAPRPSLTAATRPRGTCYAERQDKWLGPSCLSLAAAAGHDDTRRCDAGPHHRGARPAGLPPHREGVAWVDGRVEEVLLDHGDAHCKFSQYVRGFHT